MTRPGRGPSGANSPRFDQAMQEAADLLQAGRASEALPLLSHAQYLRPADVDVTLNLGAAYIMTNQHDQAIAILEKAAKAKPQHSKIWINLGAAFLGDLAESSAEDQTRAIGAFERALELDPAAPSVNYNLGLIYRDQGNLELAVAQFSRAAAINPFDEDARRLLVKTQRLLDGGSASVVLSDSSDGGTDG